MRKKGFIKRFIVGVLAAALVLTMLPVALPQTGQVYAAQSYIGEKKWLNNYEWKDKIKEGSTSDLLYVLGEIDKAVKSEIESSLEMLLDEEGNANLVTGKILNKVNKVNDFAKVMMEDLGRKPTVKEVAAEMKVSEDEINEAISLSAENIENIDYPKTIKKD